MNTGDLASIGVRHVEPVHHTYALFGLLDVGQEPPSDEGVLVGASALFGVALALVGGQVGGRWRLLAAAQILSLAEVRVRVRCEGLGMHRHDCVPCALQSLVRLRRDGPADPDRRQQQGPVQHLG